MKRIITFLKTLLLLGVLLFVNNIEAQIEIINPDTLVIQNVEGFDECYSVYIKNTLDSLYLFDWSFDIPEELSPYFRKDIHDFNMGWISSVDSSCGLDKPNQFLPLHLSSFWICVRLDEKIPNDLLHLVDSIKLELLSHPNCDLVLGETQFIGSEISNTNQERIEQVTVFPNPVRNSISLVDLEVENLDYEIINLNGAIVQSGTLQGEQINFDFVESGYYIIKLRSGNLSFHSSFVKI